MIRLTKQKRFITLFIIIIALLIIGPCKLNLLQFISIIDFHNLFVPRDVDKPVTMLDKNSIYAYEGCSTKDGGKDKLLFCKLEYSCPEGNGYPREDIDLTAYDYDTLNKLHPNISAGGIWQPCNCVFRTNLAIIVPYRQRDIHLRIFLNNIIPFLQNQNVAFRIFIMEQAGRELFNRAALLNIGYLEALKLDKFDCFIFHDVDLLPEDWCNLYKCSKYPRHLAVAMDKFNYRLPYGYYCGGALALHKTTMATINGFTNILFGWGGEDDDSYARFVKHDLQVIRYSEDIARYTMIKHKADKGNPRSGRSEADISNNWIYSSYDGISSVNYSVTSRNLHYLYTKIVVKLSGPYTIQEAKEYFVNTSQALRSILFRDSDEKEKIYIIIEKILQNRRQDFLQKFIADKAKNKIE